MTDLADVQEPSHTSQANEGTIGLHSVDNTLYYSPNLCMQTASEKH
jgi:hypothetical protein